MPRACTCTTTMAQQGLYCTTCAAYLKRATEWTPQQWLQNSEASRSLAGHVSPPAPSTPEPEKRFLERVRRLARANGFATYHTHRSDRSEPGFVDLVLCDGHSLLLVELKSSTGKLTREQQQWLSLLAHAGAETHVWKPHMWAEIVDRLTRKVHHADAGQP